MGGAPTRVDGHRLLRRAGRIMVATPSAGDAELIRKLLDAEFDDVVVSIDPELAAEDFDQASPQVLVLAMHPLEKAERHGLDLYRHSRNIHGHPHRTVVLCHGSEMRRAYELCRQDCFDDYVVFWPFNHDAPRLLMAVHHALRELQQGSADTPSPAVFAAQSRRILDLEAQLERYAAQGRRHMDGAGETLLLAGRDIGTALDDFSLKLARYDAPGADGQVFVRELARIRAESIENRLEAMGQVMAPLRHWAGALKETLAPQLDSARTLGELAAQVRPVVLLVDDDEMQHKLLARVLENLEIDLASAHTAAAAWRMLREQRPDIVLMDLGLPDIDGLEMTRRLKAMPRLAGIPVIMLTGQSGKKVVVDSLKAGACDFIVKPFDKEGLLTKLSKQLLRR